MNLLHRALLLVLALVLLAACQVRTYLDVDLTDPTAGTVAVQVGFDHEFQQAMGQFGGGADLLGVLEDDAPTDGWAVERFVDGDLEGVTLSKPFSSIDQLQQILAEGRVSGPQAGAIGEMTFIENRDTIRFEAVAPDLGGSGLESFDPSQGAGLLEYDARISITFPGPVIEHNGRLQGNTVTWDFEDPAALAGAELFAEARKTTGFPWVGVAALLMGVALVGLVVWRIRQPGVVEGAGDVSAPEDQEVGTLSGL